MFKRLFSKSPKTDGSATATPSSGSSSGSGSSSSTPVSSPPSTQKTFRMQNIRSTKITTSTPASDGEKAAMHARFDTLYGRFNNSADPGVKFLVNQLMINRTVLNNLITKSVLSDSDITLVESLFDPIKSLYPVLISGEYDDLQTELSNYHKFLKGNYRSGVRSLKIKKELHAKTAKARGIPWPAPNVEGNAEKTRIVEEAVRNMGAALDTLDMMRPEIRTLLRKSRVNTSAALDKFAKASAKADATSAALYTGLASALNGSASVASKSASKPAFSPNNLARLNAELNELEAGLNKENAMGKMHAELNALNGKVSKYIGANNAEPTGEEVNAYLANLGAKSFAAQMPMPPTNPPKLLGGGKRKSKTRSKKQQRNKTRKQCKERK